MKYLILLSSFMHLQAYALDFDKIVEGVKQRVEHLMNKAPAKQEREFKLPPLPQITKDPRAIHVYQKEGAIFETGKKFRALSSEQKKKYRYYFLSELVYVVRGAEGSKPELATLLNVLEQGGDREGVYRSLVLDQAYKNLESYRENCSKQVIEFGYQFGVKYLNLNFKQEDMKQLNLWSVKRIIVEKALELIDAFPTDGKNLYLWYGILSAELAGNYTIWNNKLRKQKHTESHIAWAKSVPIQHLKSEVIIKLNRIFNHLQDVKSH
jgi:hypothetical protein